MGWATILLEHQPPPHAAHKQPDASVAAAAAAAAPAALPAASPSAAAVDLFASPLALLLRQACRPLPGLHCTATWAGRSAAYSSWAAGLWGTWAAALLQPGHQRCRVAMPLEESQHHWRHQSSGEVYSSVYCLVYCPAVACAASSVVAGWVGLTGAMLLAG